MKYPSATSLVLFGFSLGLLATAGASSLGSSVFPDVPSGSYFDAAVGEMYAEGIITGYQNGKFGPNDFVTRGQVAVMMQRLKNDLTGVPVSSAPSSRRSISSSSASSADESESASSSASTATVTPTEAGAFRFTTGSFKGNEDQGVIKISIIRYGGAKGPVTVEYVAESSTATSGNDFTETKGTLTFADGKSTGGFDIPIIDDNEKEGNETIIVKLKNAGGGAQVGGPAQANVTIVDNDEGSGTSADTANTKGVFTFSASEYSIAENGGSIVITVNRSGTDGTASVKFETTNGTADQSYYDQNNASLDFASGESSKTMTITIKDNSATNGNKTVNLKLSNATGGATIGSLNAVTLIIVDDEVSAFGNGKFKLNDDEFAATEGSTVYVIIKRMTGTKGEVNLDYATENVLAKAGEDFTEVKGTLTFKEGESQKIIAIPIVKDTKDDPRETFKFKISNATGGTSVDPPSSATITIE